MCNLGSINLSRIESIAELSDVVELSTKFLLCGTLRAHLPYLHIAKVREKNRRLGLGLMGVHEWLIQRGYTYEVCPELNQWLSVYKGVSESTSKSFSELLSVSTPVANRAIAPTGTIGILAGTTTGIEPIYAVAYKRRYLTRGKRWKYQYAVDHAAQTVVNETGVDPDSIETALSLSSDIERRVRFQADLQDYVDMGISSTLNLPNSDSSDYSREVGDRFADVLATYAPRLRGLTCYPDGSRGGQPLTTVPYEDAVKHLGTEFDEHVEYNDVCEITGGGHCGS